MFTAAVLGATGYAGAELTRILLGHPRLGRLVLASTSAKGEALGAVWPNLLGLGRGGPEPRLVDPETALADPAIEVFFSSLPHGHAERLAGPVLARGGLFIDLSADFRFGEDEAAFHAAYGQGYQFPELHRQAVYGLSERNRAAIAKARLIGNPGCYPTAAALGLQPALAKGLARGLVTGRGIVIDAKSGVTGAGKEPTRTTHYAEAADTLAPYKIGTHRHAPEIERSLAAIAGAPVGVVFTPHLAPMGRGIVSTMYLPLARPTTVEELHALWSDFYADEPFVRVLPPGSVATNREVRLSNFCDISVHLARGGETAIVVAAIDNMVKGAAGQAVQNMNIALGLDETEGLRSLPAAF